MGRWVRRKREKERTKKDKMEKGVPQAAEAQIQGQMGKRRERERENKKRTEEKMMEVEKEVYLRETCSYVSS